MYIYIYIYTYRTYIFIERERQRERYRCILQACASQGTFSNQTELHGIANLRMNLGVLFLLRCWRSMLCAHVRAAFMDFCTPTHQQDSNVETFFCILESYWHWYFADEVDKHNEHHPPTPHQQISNAMKFNWRPLGSIFQQYSVQMHEIALNRPLEPYFTKTQLKNKIESWENIFQ